MSNDADIATDARNEIVGHLPALRAFAVSLTRNQSSADDLVQDTIVKAWVHIHKFNQGTNMRAWLFTILRNTFYSDLRKHRREVADPEGEHTSRLYVKPDHDGSLAYRDFLVAFNRLSPEHREALSLVGALGFSYEETAATVGVAVGTIKSRISRARLRLCELLELRDGENILADVDGSLAAVLSRSGGSV